MIPFPAVFAEEPFSANDIIKLAEFGPAPLKAGADPEGLAARLGDTFRRSLDWVCMTRQGASKAEEEQFFKAIATSGRTLLKALIGDAEPRSLLANPNADLGYSPGMLRLERTPSLMAHQIVAIASVRHLNGTFFGHDVMIARNHLFGMAPYVLAALISIADDGLGSVGDRKSRKGPKSNDFAEVLFNGLAAFHLEMFGSLPHVDEERGDRCGESIDWGREILLLAMERIPPILIPRIRHGLGMQALELERAALEEVAALSSATVADRLKDGAAFVRAWAVAP